MPARAIVAPINFTDVSGLPVINVNPNPLIPGASYEWRAEELPLGLIYKWQDRITGAAMQAAGADTGSQRPEVVDLANAVRVVRFDGSNDRMFATLNMATPKTVIVVGRLRTNAAIGKWLVNSGQSGTQYLHIGTDSIGGAWSSNAGSSLTQPGAVDTNMHAFITVFNGASSVVSMGGVEATGTTGTNVPTQLQLGASSSAYADTDIAFLAVLPFAATAAQRASIAAALTAQYKL